MRGTQSLERATEVLKQISRFGRRGTALSAIAGALGLANSTCHRLLCGLVEVGLAHFDPSTKLYRIGPLAYELGMVAVSPLAQLDRCRPIIKEVARRTEDTAYLMTRNETDVVCLLREEGSYFIRANIIEVGGRRPLCDSVAGIATLSKMSDDQADDLIDRSSSLTTDAVRLSRAQIRDRIAYAKRTGVAYWTGVVMPDVAGVAVAVPSPSGQCYMSIAVSAMQSRLPESRIRAVRQILFEARDQLSASVF